MMKQFDYEAFCARMDELRMNTNMSYTKLAEKIQVDRFSLSKYIRGVNMMSVETLFKFCAYFGCSADWLLGLEDD